MDRHSNVCEFRNHKGSILFYSSFVDDPPLQYATMHNALNTYIQFMRFFTSTGTNLSVHTFGFAAGTTPHPNHPGLVELVHQMKNLTDEQYQEKLQRLKNAREHFTYQGLFKQIERFIQDPFGENGGQLRCIKHPRTERCCDKA